MKRWTNDDIRFLRDHYLKISNQKVYNFFSKKYTPKAIRNQAGRLGICSRLRKYFHDDNFFIKNNNQCFYWAGFIAADGYIDEIRSKIYITLNVKDKDHLIKYKNAVQYTGPISYIPSNNAVCVRISSKFLINVLKNKFNITTKKSLTLKHPKYLTDNQARHFIRGYFDGDGYLRKNKGHSLSILGTKSMLQWINKILERNLDIGQGKHIYKYSRLKYSILEYAGRIQVHNIMNWLYNYSNNSIRLSRKYQIYQERYCGS